MFSSGLRSPRFLFPAFLLIAAMAHAQPAPGASVQATPTQVPTVVLDGLGRGTAPLDGPWQFHLGDNPAWAAPDADDAAWEQLTADAPWGAQNHPSYEGFAWYRRHISVSPAPGASPDFALMLQPIDDAYQIFWNGQLIAQKGKMPPRPVWYPYQPAQTFGLGPVRSGVLALRVWKSPFASNDPAALGGFEGVPLIGSPQAIANAKSADDFRWLRSNQIDFTLASLYVLVGLFSLVSWLRDRQHWLLFWMVGYTLATVGAEVLSGMRLPTPASLSIGLLQPTLMLQDISLWFVLLWLLNLQNNRRVARFTRIAAYIFCVAFTLDGVVEMFWGWGWSLGLQIIDAILTAIFTPLELLPFALIAAALLKRSRLDRARWLVAISATVAELIFLVRNAASQGVRFTHWTLTDRLNAPLFSVFGNAISPRVLANTLLLLAIVYAVYRYSVDERRRRTTIEQELKNARELQQVLVPEALATLPGFTLTSAYRPAQEVGGDFFQIIPLEGGSSMVILGDVSGKGLRAAMAVSLIVGAARMVADFTNSPAEILAGLNRRLFGRLQGGFATCVAMRIDTNGQCIIASAGHPAPYLNDAELALPGALPLGVVATAEYEEVAFTLQKGDHFALYTDGLLEARNHAGELYGFERLESLFDTRPTASEASDAAVSFGQDDDITVLMLTRLLGEEEVAPLQPL